MTLANWRFWLCDTKTMDQIDEIDIYSKQMQPQLNSPGQMTGWMHLLDPKAADVVTHQTAIRADRNNITQWSGPVWKLNEITQATTGEQSANDQCQITVMGWLQIFNQRLIHTGQEFQAMMYELDANGNPITSQPTDAYQEWTEQNDTEYVQVGVDEATTLSYSATQFPTTTDAAIIFDLLDRANIDSPTGITRGTIYGAPAQRNLTLQRFQNVGQQIMALVNTEDGCDIYIDPVTRQMNLYGPGASLTPTISNGMGVDRGQGCLFSLPGNCTTANRSIDGTQTANRIEAIGQYSVGRADSLISQMQNGLFEVADTLSDVVDPNILIAYANEEVTVLQYPWTIITFTPRGLTEMDDDTPAVPRPYVDYEIGDITYVRIDRGRLQVGSSGVPQATRVFGWTLTIDDNNSVEKLTSISTTYQGLTSS